MAMEREGLVLRAVRGDRNAGVYGLDDRPVSIGRWEGASLPLDDAQVLPVHVVLDPEGNGRWRLISLAPEGCLLNGRLVLRALVESGDRLQIGPFEIALDGDVARVASTSMPPPRPPRGLRAVLHWQGSPLDARMLAPDDVLTVGTARDVTFALSESLHDLALPKRCALVATIQGVWHVALDTPLRALDLSGDAHPLLSTEVHAKGPTLARGLAGAKLWVPLPPSGRVRLDAGELAIDLEPADFEALPKVTRPPRWATPDGTRAIITAMFLVLVILMLRHPPPSQFFPGSEAARGRQLVAQFQAPTRSKELEEKLKQWRRVTADRKEESAAKAMGEEGRAGRPNAPARQARRAGPKSDAEIVRENALLRALASGATAELLSGGALSAANAIGHLDGPAIGDADGTLGLGLRGDARGGGGSSSDTVGIGPVGTRGLGRDAAGAGRVGRREQSELSLDEPASVEGGLEREVIRRVILSHRAQIRYCYEKQLANHPDLAGKVAAEFVIAADGRVTSARAAESTLADPEVGRCVVSKIRSWTFPQPKGGGVVVVTYPFLFKPAGQGAK